MQFTTLLAAVAGLSQLAAALPAGEMGTAIGAAKDKRQWELIGGGACVKTSCYDRVVEADGEVEETVVETTKST
ncbi:hypothetical protein GQ53DRAFT_832003 [Thozetella sp. PMI_491]|nr:hypothetical protein GQ53DRAFT_832003 [Thozetella sp. PMI_491]